MAINNILPIAVGTSSTSADLATKLGELYEKSNSDGTGAKLYRLVKNDSATTMAANYVVITKQVLGVPSYKVNTTTTANHPLVCGVVPSDFGSNTIADQAYFLLQVSGPCTFLCGNLTTSNTAAITALGTATTAGNGQTVTVTGTSTIYDAAAVFGKATFSAIVTAVGVASTGIIEGLV